MVECPVCGDMDFQEVAGHFYCTTCNTQSQETRVMDVDTDSLMSFPSLTSKIHVKKKKNESRIAGVDKKFQPFSVYEAYEIILLHQVDALIKLGADPQVKKIIFKIWANYLAMVGVAFADQDVTTALIEYSQKRKGFIFKADSEKSVGQNKKASRDKKKRKDKNKKKDGEEADKDGSTKGSSSEDLSDNSDPDTDWNDAEDSESDTEVMKELAVRQEGARFRRNTSILKMQMQFTLCFCYMGLMATNPLTTIGDLLRWAKQSVIPYSEARELLPPEMKAWNKTFNVIAAVQTIPTREEFRRKLVTVSRHLGITEETMRQFPLLQLVHQYIYQLDLPAELHVFATLLVERAKQQIEKFKYFKLLFWEGVAMAYIVVLLKLLYGVNDQTERLFSSYSKDMNELYYGGEEKLFVWDRWIVHVAEKIQVLDAKYTVSESSKVADAEVSSALGRPMTRVTNTRGERLLDPEFRKSLQKPFLDLVEKWVERSKRDKGDNSSVCGDADELDFSDRSTVNSDTLGLMVGLYDEEERDVSPELSSLLGQSEVNEEMVVRRGETLRKCSLIHLLDPKKFVLDREAGEAKDGEAGVEGMDVDEEQDTSEVPAADGSDNNKHTSESETKKRYSRTKRYRNVLRHYDYIKEKYFLSSTKKKTLEDPVSYKWMMHLFCKFIDCKPQDLSNLVERLESHIRARRKQMVPKKHNFQDWLGGHIEN